MMTLTVINRQTSSTARDSGSEADVVQLEHLTRNSARNSTVSLGQKR